MRTEGQAVSIAVVGSGYVGLVAAACFAEIGHHVICVDNDESKVRMLRAGGVPIHEEHLPELLARHRGNRLEFTTDLRAATQGAQAIFIAVGTPQSQTGSADLSYVDAVASEIARSIDAYKVIVEKSTVPVYTNEWIRRVIERNGVPKELFDVTSNPEFLREGTAVVDFLHADRIVIGAATESAANLLKSIYYPSDLRRLLQHSRCCAGTASVKRSTANSPDINEGRGDYQTRIECVPGDQDFVHQCDRKCV